MSISSFHEWKTRPLSSRPEISIIIPAYNEAERIVPTIGAIASFMCDLDLPWELIIADDGSTDETVAVVSALELVNMRVLQTPTNGGKGSAVRRGMLAAHGRLVLFTDADNSTPIEELSRLLPQVTRGDYEIAVGSRAVAGAAAANRSWLRRLLSRGLHRLVSNVFDLGVQDTQCGFKLYTRDAAQQLHGKQTLMGFSFDLELLYLARKFHYAIAEVPVQWIDAPGSKVQATREVRRFLEDLFRIKLNDWRGIYETAI